TTSQRRRGLDVATFSDLLTRPGARCPSPPIQVGSTTAEPVSSAGLADLVDLRSAEGAGPNRSRLTILHGDGLRVPHFDLLLVLQAITFHYVYLTTWVLGHQCAYRSQRGPHCMGSPLPIQPQFAVARLSWR